MVPPYRARSWSAALVSDPPSLPSPLQRTRCTKRADDFLLAQAVEAVRHLSPPRSVRTGNAMSRRRTEGREQNMALTWPLVQEGSSGEDVRSVQYLVTAQGHAVTVDGIFGPQTKGAVQAFQAAHGLATDGIVGNQTWPQLILQVASGSTGE